MDGLSSDGLDRLPLLCPLIEEIHVSGFSFSGSTLARSGLCFPRLKKLVFGNVCNLEAKHLEVFCPLHPKLTHIEFVCNYPADSNGRIFLRSLSSPLRSFAMDNIVNGTLNSLGKRCIDSLETIKVRFLKEADEQRLTHQIFSTFHRLRNVSLYLWKGNLNDLPVLPCLQTFSLRRVSSCLVQDLIEFLRSYPHLKELHTKNFALNDELAEEVATNLPDLCSFSFSFNRLTSPGLMALTQLKQLKYFNMGFSSELSPTDVCAFVRQMPSLRRLVIENIHFPTLLKALRNEFRSCAFDRKLWVSQNDFKFFLVDPSEACTDEAIDKFDLKVDQYFDSDHASLISFYQIWLLPQPINAIDLLFYRRLRSPGHAKVML